MIYHTIGQCMLDVEGAIAEGAVRMLLGCPRGDASEAEAVATRRQRHCACHGFKADATFILLK
jgi:hypothetical protein